MMRTQLPHLDFGFAIKVAIIDQLKVRLKFENLYFPFYFKDFQTFIASVVVPINIGIG